MRKFILFSAGLALGLGLADYFGVSFIHPYKWLIFAFLLLVALGVHGIIEWVTRKHAQDWVIYYLGIVVGRLLLSIGFLAWFIFTDTPAIYHFVGNFFVLYLCYSGFEIYTLLGNLRRNSIS